MRVIEGDCLSIMPTLDADSVDAVICDPPYGLKFMGKEWDHGIPGAPFWEAARRVAKPGAYLLAFGGTRTFHRLTCAIEDAGWEIRDCLMFLYGSGFPKSHNIGCRCGEPTTECNLRSLPESDLSQAINTEDEQGEALLTGVSESPIPTHGAARAESQNATRKQSGVEGRRNLQAEQGELYRPEVREVPTRVRGDGKERRVRDGASAGNGTDDGAVSDANGSRASSRPQHAAQRAGESAILPEQRSAQTGGRACSTCGGLTDRRGYGTALKPSWEPIILVRKPIIGTVAANVQEHGTGALNIDGCRIETDPIADASQFRTMKRNLRPNDGWGMSTVSGDEPQVVHPSGRWPANLILDEEAAAMLDEQSGESTSGRPREERGKGGIWHRSADGIPAGPQHGDTGGASRFFYTSKASRSEREAGLDGMPLKVSGGISGTADGSLLTGSGNVRNNRSTNNHPTVKPLDLMQWLCRLVTPKGGLILDPFCGSGTTGRAAIAEGFSFIGIELSPEYAAIARARIAEYAPLFGDVA